MENKNEKDIITDAINGELKYNKEIISYGFIPLENFYKFKIKYKYIDSLGIINIESINVIRNTFKFENMLKKAKEIHNNMYDYSKAKYSLKTIKTCIICHIHGEFFQTPSSHAHGSGCPKCARDRITNASKKSFDEHIAGIHEYNKKNKVINIYRDKNNKVKVDYICQFCANKEYGKSIDLLKRSIHVGCNNCKVERIKSSQKFDKDKVEKRIYSVNKKIKVEVEEYVNAITPMNCSCKICGNMWKASYDNLYRGRGCPVCANNNLINDGGYNETSAKRNKDEWSIIDAIVYIVAIRGENESFYKIGITKKNTYRARFNSIKSNYETLDIIKIFDCNLYEAIFIEKDLHLINNENRYIPEIKFGGYTECFNKLEDVCISKYIIENNLKEAYLNW